MRRILIKINDFMNGEPFPLKRPVLILSGLYLCSSLALAASGNNMLSISHFCTSAYGGAFYCILRAFDLFCDHLRRTDSKK